MFLWLIRIVILKILVLVIFCLIVSNITNLYYLVSCLKIEYVVELTTPFIKYLKIPYLL